MYPSIWGSLLPLGLFLKKIHFSENLTFTMTNLHGKENIKINHCEYILLSSEKQITIIRDIFTMQCDMCVDGVGERRKQEMRKERRAEGKKFFF